MQLRTINRYLAKLDLVLAIHTDATPDKEGGHLNKPTEITLERRSRSLKRIEQGEGHLIRLRNEPTSVYQARYGDGECDHVLGTFATLDSAQRRCEWQYGMPGWWRKCPWSDDIWMLMTGTGDDAMNTAYDVIRYDVQE